MSEQDATIPDGGTVHVNDEARAAAVAAEEQDAITLEARQQTAAALLAAVEPSKPNTEPEYGAGCVPSEPHAIRSREDDRVALSERKPGA